MRHLGEGRGGDGWMDVGGTGCRAAECGWERENATKWLAITGNCVCFYKFHPSRVARHLLIGARFAGTRLTENSPASLVASDRSVGQQLGALLYSSSFFFVIPFRFLFLYFIEERWWNIAAAMFLVERCLWPMQSCRWPTSDESSSTGYGDWLVKKHHSIGASPHEARQQKGYIGYK